ncbi:sodium-dependent bicarbonate transport family permease [Biformimicrobium ophioploci]|uniref:Sodium-dependent bicarbonate transport family permease n=1 Tax=Biformimicrobium ophioploci TaxID=3036711 RepID=A0ABQ6LVM2_9GAMM|nr:sodium-dependent bicarbonate transport family permease [Microbulbifer sp. NKW57]GMG86116.1 sodium-dependent bicarbonate transport family permease [Microbulbifer sp. NKW57]
MQLDIVVAFFLFGMAATLVGSKIHFSRGLSQGLTLFLLIAIGLKGGVALSEHASVRLVPQALLVLLLGLALPFIAYPLLRRIGQWNRTDAAATAAHYGSVSVGTFAVAIALLDSRGVDYEAYFPLFVVLLEVPAIAIGIYLATRGDKKKARLDWHELLLNQGCVLLFGGLLIGWMAGTEGTAKVMPLFSATFHGALALFLLNMGCKAAEQFPQVMRQGAFLTSFAIVMPLVGATIGGSLATLMDFSIGGIALLATLGASASYIAAPAALGAALPNANMSLPLTASLAITFPFNVLVGIPVYLAAATYISQSVS